MWNALIWGASRCGNRRSPNQGTYEARRTAIPSWFDAIKEASSEPAGPGARCFVGRSGSDRLPQPPGGKRKEDRRERCEDAQLK